MASRAATIVAALQSPRLARRDLGQTPGGVALRFDIEAAAYMPWPERCCGANLRFVPRTSRPYLPVVKRSTSFEPEVAKVLGEVIRGAREVQGIAQDAFALLANVDRSYYGKLERGERQPTVGLLLRIGRALDVPASELLEHVEAKLQVRPARRRRKA
jgi:DNA-binding XRE family transcriptional regulator